MLIKQLIKYQFIFDLKKIMIKEEKYQLIIIYINLYFNKKKEKKMNKKKLNE